MDKVPAQFTCHGLARVQDLRSDILTITLIRAAYRGRVDVVVAVAFHRVLQTTKPVALRPTVCLTHLDCHTRVVGEGNCVQRTSAQRRIIVTSQVCLESREAEGLSDGNLTRRGGHGIYGASHTRPGNTRRAGHSSRRGSCRTRSEFNASRKLCNRSCGGLADLWWPQRAVGLKSIALVLFEDRTVTDDTKLGTVGVQTFVNSFLLNVHVPSVLKISVESVSCSISLRESVLSAGFEWHLSHTVQHLEEQMRDLVRVSGRTNTVVNLRLIGDLKRGQKVRFAANCMSTYMAVVGKVEVHSIPAALELDLSS